MGRENEGRTTGEAGLGCAAPSAGPGQGGIRKPGPQIGQGSRSRGGILLKVWLTPALGQSDLLGKNSGGPSW
jgi:hypothetical protein